MQKRTLHGVRLKPTEPKGYEFEVGGFDFHVRNEQSRWVLDQFDAKVADANEAHLDSSEHETLGEAVLHAVEEMGPSGSIGASS